MKGTGDNVNIHITQNDIYKKFTCTYCFLLNFQESQLTNTVEANVLRQFCHANFWQCSNIAVLPKILTTGRLLFFIMVLSHTGTFITIQTHISNASQVSRSYHQWTQCMLPSCTYRWSYVYYRHNAMNHNRHRSMPSSRWRVRGA